ncbi:methyl-accepting chemotaxis protein [Pseudomonas sp. RIT-PI-q]|uniref:methyl-accepting chemotaxis protein n=1 Tax=Pseudomonas sp. RIT-PI-q TaxID=1690247 RepID=UPI0007513E9F|nr:methyl-accepting chemotaxis protein [Pseudomonas sp. RIT-PI-q]
MLRNLSIAWRASIGFSIIVALTGALGLFALSEMNDMREGTRQISDDWLPGVMTLSHAAQNVQRIRALTLRMVLTSNPQALEQNYAKLESLKAETRTEISAYENTIRVPEDRAIFERFKGAETAYMQLQGKVVELSRKGQLDEAREIINGEMNQHADALSKNLNELIDFNDRGANDAASTSVEVFVKARTGVMWALLVVSLASFVLAAGLIRSIVLPLRQSVELAKIVSTGDLTTRIEIVGTDEPAQLMEALGTMQRKLRDTLVAIAESSNQLASASEELSTVTEDASRGAVGSTSPNPHGRFRSGHPRTDRSWFLGW